MVSKRLISLMNKNIINRNLNLRFAQLTIKLLSSSAVFEKNYGERKLSKIKTEKLEQERNNYEDTFGTLDSFEYKFSRIKEDPEDVEWYKKSKLAQGKTPRQYLYEIKNYLANHDYKNAIKVLEYDMVNDGIRPIPHFYDILVAYNAERGDLKEAYRLYTNLKKRKGQISGGMYTSLFNACANCQNSYLALEKFKAIREYLEKDKKISMNTTHYNVMLKALGRHGDVLSGLKLFDEVMEKRDKIKVETFHFMFHVCISDKNSGLRNALLVWRKMLQLRIEPSIFVFNLLLRCVRDCSLGETALLNDLIEQIKKDSKKFYVQKVTYKMIDGTKKRIVKKIPVDGKFWIESLKQKSQKTSKKRPNYVNVIASNDELILIENEETKNALNTALIEGGNDNLVTANYDTSEVNVECAESVNDNVVSIDARSQEEMHSDVLTNSNETVTESKPSEGAESLKEDFLESNLLTSAVHNEILEKKSDIKEVNIECVESSKDDTVALESRSKEEMNSDFLTNSNETVTESKPSEGAESLKEDFPESGLFTSAIYNEIDKQLDIKEVYIECVESQNDDAVSLESRSQEEMHSDFLTNTNETFTESTPSEGAGALKEDFLESNLLTSALHNEILEKKSDIKEVNVECVESSKNDTVSIESRSKEETNSDVLTNTNETFTESKPSEGAESLKEDFLESGLLTSAVDNEILEKKSDIIELATLRSDAVSKREDTERLPEVENLEELKDITRKVIFNEGNEFPNLLDFEPSIESVVKFGPMTEPYKRFLFLGGVKGFLKVMTDFNVKPNVKTFSLMMEVIPNTPEAEKKVLGYMKYFNVKMDTGFCNIMMLRRNKRDDYEGAKEFFALMKKYKLEPCIRSFGILAIGCRTHESALEFIELARKHNVRFNSQILGALLMNAGKAEDMKYVKTILKIVKEDQPELSTGFLLLLKNIVEKAKKKRQDLGNFEERKHLMIESE